MAIDFNSKIDKTEFNETVDSLQTELDGKAASNHNHDSSYLSKSGGYLEGSINLGVHDLILEGNDSGDIIFRNSEGEQKGRIWMSDSNGTMIISPNSNTNGPSTLVLPYDSNDLTIGGNKIYHQGNKPTPKEIGSDSIYESNRVISTANKWFTLFELQAYDANGSSFASSGSMMLQLTRSYNTVDNESYIFLITGSFQNVKVTQLSGSVKYSLYAKLRLVSKDDNKFKIECYIHNSDGNEFYAKLSNVCCHSFKSITSTNFSESNNLGSIYKEVPIYQFSSYFEDDLRVGERFVCKGLIDSYSLSTCNAQLLNAVGETIYVGNPNTKMYIESSEEIKFKVGNNIYTGLHTGNIGGQTCWNSQRLQDWTADELRRWNSITGKPAGADISWYWSGQEGQPTWVWGNNDTTDSYVYNPRNFHVRYADSAGHSSTCDKSYGCTIADDATSSQQVSFIRQGQCGIFSGNGDGSGWGVANMFIKSHWGINFLNNTGNSSFSMDTRTGWLHCTGRYVSSAGTYSLTNSSTQDTGMELLLSEKDNRNIRILENEVISDTTVEDVLPLLDKIVIKKMADNVQEQITTFNTSEEEVSERVLLGQKQKLGFTTDMIADDDLFDLIGDVTQDGEQMVSHMSMISLLVLTCQSLKREIEELKASK